MQLKLKELQNVARATIKEEKSLDSLRKELIRVLGPSIDIPGSNKKIVSLANEQLDLLEATGRFPREGSFKTSVLIEASSSDFSGARKVAARLLPANLVSNLINDPFSSVRCAAAKKLPSRLVEIAARRNPGDDDLQVILRAKKLAESGLPNPTEKEDAFDFDMYGKEPLGDVVKQKPGEDYSDAWYELKARDICREYGANIEGQWEEAIASRVASSAYSVGQRLDKDKLLKKIYDHLKEREDKVTKEGSLRAISSKLIKESYLDAAVLPVIEEVQDQVKDLLESRVSSKTYIEKAEELFSVKKSLVPPGIKKYVVGENYDRFAKIPVLGRLPRGSKFDSRTERALDAYVSHWNNMQSSIGEPFKISWNSHPSDDRMIGFRVELK